MVMLQPRICHPHHRHRDESQSGLWCQMTTFQLQRWLWEQLRQRLPRRHRLHRRTSCHRGRSQSCLRGGALTFCSLHLAASLRLGPEKSVEVLKVLVKLVVKKRQMCRASIRLCRLAGKALTEVHE